MIKNIKSQYFINLILSYVDDIKKLKIIQYNKSLQNIMNLSIINYIHFTGKYILYGSNKIGKEYYGIYNNMLELAFEGKFLKGERNGNGKKYWYNDTLKFEGEYLNGKKKWKRKRILD